MKFGVREICNVVFRANETKTIGNRTFQKGAPVFYIDTAKTSTIEGAATSVYATGGRGNSRLITWEGEKTLTFTVEDALLSPISFSALSGAGVVKGLTENDYSVHYHQTSRVPLSIQKGTANAQHKIPYTYVADLRDIVPNATEATPILCGAVNAQTHTSTGAPVYVYLLGEDGEITSKVDGQWQVSTASVYAYKAYRSQKTVLDPEEDGITEDEAAARQAIVDANDAFKTANDGKTVLVDYYVLKKGSEMTELQIDAEHFGGSFYVEADTLFRRQSDGVDLPANLTFPNVKIQSNFTFSMASSGDPSTFTFTMDAMPGYTYFNKTKKVLCAIQVVEDGAGTTYIPETVFKHTTGESISV